MYTIHVQFEQQDLQSTIIHCEEDHTVLEAVLLNDIHLNHNCGGVCACTTCHIYIEEGEDFIDEMSEREEDYVDRATNPRLNSRLACQCLLLPLNKQTNATVSITIPDQSDIIGHEH